jgi:hypothetical protein
MVESKPTEMLIRCSLSEDFNQSSDRNDILVFSGVDMAPILGNSTPALSSVVWSNWKAPDASQVSQYPNRFFNFREPSSEHDEVRLEASEFWNQLCHKHWLFEVCITVWTTQIC